MKYKIISALLILALIGLFTVERVDAQTTKKAGIKGGLNVSNLYIDNINDEDARIGTNVGFFGQVVASDAAALQLELLYSTKGAQAMYSGAGLNQQVKYNLNYLDLPVLAAIKLGKSAEIHLGGYASYLLNANISYSGDLANGTDEVDKDHLKSFDYGLSGGIGFNFGMVQVGGRYNYGLVKIADSDAARAVMGDSKNSNAQVYIAFNLIK